MINNGRVQGSRESAVNVWRPCGKWVYVHTNIQAVPKPDGWNGEWDVWEYDEVIYSADEYRGIETEKLRADVDYILIMEGL
jgi:hypothetical protein